MGDLYGMIVSSFKKPENMLSDTEEKVTIAFLLPPELSGLSGVSGALPPGPSSSFVSTCSLLLTVYSEVRDPGSWGLSGRATEEENNQEGHLS